MSISERLDASRVLSNKIVESREPSYVGATLMMSEKAVQVFRIGSQSERNIGKKT